MMCRDRALMSTGILQTLTSKTRSAQVVGLHRRPVQQSVDEALPARDPSLERRRWLRWTCDTNLVISEKAIWKLTVSMRLPERILE